MLTLRARALLLVSLCAMRPLNAVVTRADLLAPRPVTGPMTISSPGSYQLARNIRGQITISANNVSLNLNNYTVSNSALTGDVHGIVVNSLAQHIEIENGSIGPITAGNGVEVTAGCFDITIRRLHIFQCDTGINMTSTPGIVLKECIFFQSSNDGVKLTSCAQCAILTCAATTNNNGFVLDQTTDVQVRDCASAANITSGFYLSSVQRAAFLDCRAVSNGATCTVDACGFYSANGTLNSFTGCIAENTTTTATAEQYKAAGFLFSGTENHSSIIKCIISNTSTSTSDQSTAYGIMMEKSLSDLSENCSSDRGGTVNSCVWTPDNAYILCAGPTVSGNEISVYQHNTVDNKLRLLHENMLGAEVKTLAFNYKGTRLAVGGATGIDNNDIRVFDFDTETGELELEDNTRHGATINSICWAPSERYFVAGGEAASGNEIRLYQYKKSSGTIQQRNSISVGATVYAIDWDTGCYHVAAGGAVAGGNEIRVYKFDPRAKDLTLKDSAAHGATVYAVAWTSDTKYLAIGGAAGTGGYDIRVYEYDSTANTLTLRDSQTHGATVRSVSWSSDDTHLAIAGDTATSTDARVYSFSNTTKTLTLEQSKSHGANLNCIIWSPNGHWLSVGGVSATSITHRILNGFSTPYECLIAGNTIFNVKGNSRKTSTGIYAPSSLNLIVENTLYNNNVDKKFN